jgi:hypothetical protein
MRANVVAVGTPVETRSMWEYAEGRNRIVTYHRFQVERVAAGKLDGTEVWVRSLGGRVGDIGQVVEGEAVLPQGKKLMLFLTNRGDGSMGVVGMEQGVWVVIRGTDGIDRVQAGVRRAAVVANREKTSARLELGGRTLEDAVARVLTARAAHAP